MATQQPSLRAAVPDEAVLVVEMADPAAATQELLHAIGAVPTGLKEQVGAPAWAFLAAAWVAVDGDAVAFARDVAGDGAVLAVVPMAAGAQSVALLRPRSAEVLTKWLARFAARVPHEVVDGTFVVGNDRNVVQRTAARVRSGGSRWQQIDFGPAAALRGAVDLAAIRRAAGAMPSTLDAGARFLLLPLVHAAFEAEVATFALAGGERLVATVRAATSVRGTKAGGLLTAGEPHPAVPLPADGLATLRLERSVRALLQAPERYLRPAEVLAVQGFLSIADAIDGARSSFVDDLLGGLGEPFTLHVLPITPPVDGPPPRLQLPGFAVVAPITDPKAEAVLFRVAEAFFFIANAERAQRGQVLFPARARRSERGRGLVGEPLPWRGPGAPPIEQALSPTVWCENGHAVLASTHAAAMAVVAAAQAPGLVEPADTLVLRAADWGPVLAASRSVFELGRMLDEGEDRADTARFFDILATVVGAVREISLSVRCDARTTTLEVAIARSR
ncbi:MAG: hypothetical protein JNK15_10455 [Planctomycetes bacterium]|nr:hypothetical protein [Planctomycetota bacterium]